MVTYGDPIEDLVPYEDDEDARWAYAEYLQDHAEYMNQGGILYADDFETWLRYNVAGRFHRDRIDNA